MDFLFELHYFYFCPYQTAGHAQHPHWLAAAALASFSWGRETQSRPHQARKRIVHVSVMNVHIAPCLVLHTLSSVLVPTYLFAGCRKRLRVGLFPFSKLLLSLKRCACSHLLLSWTRQCAPESGQAPAVLVSLTTGAS